MRRPRTPRRELGALLDAGAPLVQREIVRLGEARLRRDEDAVREAKRDLARALGDVVALAALLGARRAYLYAEHHRRRGAARVDPATMVRATLGAALHVPAVEYERAARAILDRTPMLAEAERGRWLEVAQIVRERYGFALAHSTDLQLTEAIRDLVSASITAGAPPREAAEYVADLGGFARAYAETVYRTNAATAYEAGTWRAATEVDDDVIAGFRFVTAGDPDVRPNHRVLEGVRGHKTASFWARVAPPVGYNCRCTLEPMSADELAREGENPPPANWQPESPAFRATRPDLRFFGGAGV